MKVPLPVWHVDDNPIDVRLAKFFRRLPYECDVLRVDTVIASVSRMRKVPIRAREGGIPPGCC